MSTIGFFNQCRISVSTIRVACLLLVFCTPISAHELGLISLKLDISDYQQAQFSVEMDLLDAELLLNLDEDSDGIIHWIEYRKKQAILADSIQQSISLGWPNNTCTSRFTPEASGVYEGASPSVLTVFSIQCKRAPESLTIDYQLLSNLDKSSRAFLTIQGSGGSSSKIINQSTTTIDLTEVSFFQSNFTFLKEGIHHILIGYDHLAFLLLLLLPVSRQQNARQQFLNFAGIITAFTLAHSVTLILSALGYLLIPASLVEVSIAASVLLVALLNIFRVQNKTGWAVAYGFGLIHGLGFASVLSELQIAENLDLINLASFNIGIEIGQVAIALLIFPLLRWLGRHDNYSSYFVKPVSFAIGLLACYWIYERITG